MLLGQRRQAFHTADFIDGQDTAADEDLLDLRLLQLIGRIKIGEDEFQIVPAKALAMASRVRCSANERADRHDRGAEGVVDKLAAVLRLTSCSRPRHGRQVECVGDNAHQELLPSQAQVGIGAAAKRSTSGLFSTDKMGTLPVPSISSCHQRISRS